MDGDGRPDRVIVDAPTGTVTVHTAAGKTASVDLKVSGGRLEGVSDLAHNGHGLILIDRSAAGCCGYTFVFADVTVVGLLDGHLQRFTTPSGQDPLRYDEGHGDVDEGFSCLGNGIVTETHSNTFSSQAPTATWTTTTYRLAGGTFTSIITQERSGNPRQLGPITDNAGCSGITAINRAN